MVLKETYWNKKKVVKLRFLNLEEKEDQILEKFKRRVLRVLN